jgi:hypothetical protein
MTGDYLASIVLDYDNGIKYALEGKSISQRKGVLENYTSFCKSINPDCFAKALKQSNVKRGVVEIIDELVEVGLTEKASYLDGYMKNLI